MLLSHKLFSSRCVPYRYSWQYSLTYWGTYCILSFCVTTTEYPLKLPYTVQIQELMSGHSFFNFTLHWIISWRDFCGQLVQLFDVLDPEVQRFWHYFSSIKLWVTSLILLCCLFPRTVVLSSPCHCLYSLWLIDWLTIVICGVNASSKLGGRSAEGGRVLGRGVPLPIGNTPPHWGGVWGGNFFVLWSLNGVFWWILRC